MRIKTIFGALAVIIGGIFMLTIIWYFLFPSVSHLKSSNPQKTSFMKYREKQWTRNGIKRAATLKWVPISGISPYLVKAVIIAEDDKFWEHEGFDFEAIQKALSKDFKAKRFKLGASTITQQLAKNLYLGPSKNPIRKVKEAIITWRLEKALSKRRIVEIYLNCAEWGDGIFGIEAASRRFFGKPASDLNAMEAAKLAAVLPNPIKYSPLSDKRSIVRRTNLIHDLMVRRGIVIEEYDKVMKQPHDSTAIQSDSSVFDIMRDSASERPSDPANQDSEEVSAFEGK
jgi:monofunctional biosynthetic peptidoglycan transglycosylase